jgi:hypothetical protein
MLNMTTEDYELFGSYTINLGLLFKALFEGTIIGFI